MPLIDATKATDCPCATIGDLAVLDMVHDRLDTFIQTKRRGEPWRWLSLDICRECGQSWLVGQEERQNDVCCFRRLDVETTDRILQEGIWPSDFDCYETLLEMGRDAGHKVIRGKNSLFLHSLIIDIARERPGIRTSELMTLLNIKGSDIEEVAQAAVNSSGVVITFDC